MVGEGPNVGIGVSVARGVPVGRRVGIGPDVSVGPTVQVGGKTTLVLVGTGLTSWIEVGEGVKEAQAESRRNGKQIKKDAKKPTLFNQLLLFARINLEFK